MAASILVVDDDPNLVRLMSKFLKLEGFAPVPAANGEEALTYLRATAPPGHGTAMPDVAGTAVTPS